MKRVLQGLSFFSNHMAPSAAASSLRFGGRAYWSDMRQQRERERERKVSYSIKSDNSIPCPFSLLPFYSPAHWTLKGMAVGNIKSPEISKICNRKSHRG